MSVDKEKICRVCPLYKTPACCRCPDSIEKPWVERETCNWNMWNPNRTKIDEIRVAIATTYMAVVAGDGNVQLAVRDMATKYGDPFVRGVIHKLTTPEPKKEPCQDCP